MLDEVDGISLDNIVSTETRAVLVQFWGTWCAPCRSLKPHIKRLSDDYSESWRMVSINVETDELVARRWDVEAVPTIVFLRDGEELHRFAGAVVPSQVAAELERLS